METTFDFNTFSQGFTAAMTEVTGEPWENLYDDEQDWSTRVQRERDGLTLSIYRPGGTYSKTAKGEIALSCGQQYWDLRQYDEATPRINATLTRSYLSLARDVFRRLLPEATALWDTLVERKARQDVRDAARDRVAEDLISLGLYSYGQDGVKPGQDRTLSFPRGALDGYGDVKVSGTSASIELHLLTHEQVETIVRALLGK